MFNFNTSIYTSSLSPVNPIENNQFPEKTVKKENGWRSKAAKVGLILFGMIGVGAGIFFTSQWMNSKHATVEPNLSFPEKEKEFPLSFSGATLSHRSPKVDPSYARETFPSIKQTPSTHTPKFDSKNSKEKFHFPRKVKQVLKELRKDTCLPKSGKYHKNDVIFYNKIAYSSKSVFPIETFKEKRCSGTLYLRAEDTNYMHGNDGYVRSEDTRHTGEISPSVSEKLINEGRVWYRIVEKVKDICKHIEEVHKSGGKINRVILNGHGNSQEMLLSQKGGNSEDLFRRFFNFNVPGLQFSSPPGFRFSPGDFDNPFNFGSSNSKPSAEGVGMDKYTLDVNTKFPQKGCLNLLEKDAEIILVSCKTGQKGQGLNLADALSSQVPGHRIVAPLTKVTTSDVKAKTQDGKLTLYFETPKGKDVTYTAFTRRSNARKR